MGSLTFIDKIKALINSISWKLFCWSYRGGEIQYLKDIHYYCIRRRCQ